MFQDKVVQKKIYKFKVLHLLQQPTNTKYFLWQPVLHKVQKKAQQPIQ